MFGAPTFIGVPFFMEQFMRRSLISLTLAASLALPGVAFGQTGSAPALDAEKSLQELERDFSAVENPDPNTLFALGGIRFLRAIEKTLQLRWQHNAAIEDLDMPVLRLPVPPNPEARPFYAGLITDLFEELSRDMEKSREALSAIPEDASVALAIDLRDIWFDVNMNGQREPEEDLVVIAANTVLPRRGGADDAGMPAEMVVKFDTADAAWLSAYTHLLSGISDLVLAYDPTGPIQTVMDSRERLAQLRGDVPPANAMDMQIGHFVDNFAMVYGALRQEPDASRTRSARQHFLSMIADNKRFWEAVARESDNDREWIPNDNQNAALGFEVPRGAGEAWLRVLQDGEDILNGRQLIPFWRINPAGGVNVRKMFEEPTGVDIVGWVQGHGLLPYLEQGPVANGESLRAFERLVSGRSPLFAVLFN